MKYLNYAFLLILPLYLSSCRESNSKQENRDELVGQNSNNVAQKNISEPKIDNSSSNILIKNLYILKEPSTKLEVSGKQIMDLTDKNLLHYQIYFDNSEDSQDISFKKNGKNIKINLQEDGFDYFYNSTKATVFIVDIPYVQQMSRPEPISGIPLDNETKNQNDLVKQDYLDYFNKMARELQIKPNSIQTIEPFIIKRSFDNPIGTPMPFILFGIDEDLPSNIEFKKTNELGLSNDNLTIVKKITRKKGLLKTIKQNF